MQQRARTRPMVIVEQSCRPAHGEPEISLMPHGSFSTHPASPGTFEPAHWQTESADFASSDDDEPERRVAGIVARWPVIQDFHSVCLSIASLRQVHIARILVCRDKTALPWCFKESGPPNICLLRSIRHIHATPTSWLGSPLDSTRFPWY